MSMCTHCLVVYYLYGYHLLPLSIYWWFVFVDVKERRREENENVCWYVKSNRHVFGGHHQPDLEGKINEKIQKQKRLDNKYKTRINEQ